jgi:hypothetical protein
VSWDNHEGAVVKILIGSKWVATVSSPFLQGTHLSPPKPSFVPPIKDELDRFVFAGILSQMPPEIWLISRHDNQIAGLANPRFITRQCALGWHVSLRLPK